MSSDSSNDSATSMNYASVYLTTELISIIRP